MITATCKPVTVDLLVGRITQEQVTSSTTEVELGKLIIPGGTMGRNGYAHIVAIFKKGVTNTTWKARIKFAGTIVKEASFTTANTVLEMLPSNIWNKNATNAQAGGHKHTTIHAFNSAIAIAALEVFFVP